MTRNIEYESFNPKPDCYACKSPVTRNRASILDGRTFCGACLELHGCYELSKPLPGSNDKAGLV